MSCPGPAWGRGGYMLSWACPGVKGIGQGGEGGALTW